MTKKNMTVIPNDEKINIGLCKTDTLAKITNILTEINNEINDWLVYEEKIPVLLQECEAINFELNITEYDIILKANIECVVNNHVYKYGTILLICNMEENETKDNTDHIIYFKLVPTTSKTLAGDAWTEIQNSIFSQIIRNFNNRYQDSCVCEDYYQYEDSYNKNYNDDNGDTPKIW